MPRHWETIALVVLCLEGIGALPASGNAAEPHCMAHMIHDVAAEEASEQVMSKDNKDFGPVTKIKVSRTSGRISYCVGNSYCYRADAFYLSTCRIKRNNDSTTSSYFVYSAR